MLRLNYEEYDEAAIAMAKRLAECEEAGITTNLGRALVVLEALGVDFDVEPMNPGPDWKCVRCESNDHWGITHDWERDDIESGEVWPDDNDLADRAVQAALEASPPRMFKLMRRWI